ncbi:MAG TPA: hypothetical protein VF486_24110 [Actinomycetes bacterium]
MARRRHERGRRETGSRRPTSEAEAIGHLVERVPALRPLLDAHLAEYGELLPYVLFESDFMRWFGARARAPAARDELRAFLDAVEVLMTTDAEPPAIDPVRNLAGVAFVEHLALADVGALHRAGPWLGPETLRAFEEAFPHALARDPQPGKHGSPARRPRPPTG